MRQELKCQCGNQTFKIVLEIKEGHAVEEIICVNCDEVLFDSVGDTEDFLEKINLHS